MRRSFCEFRRGGTGCEIREFQSLEKFVARETAEIPSSPWSVASFGRKRTELTGFNEPIDFYPIAATPVRVPTEVSSVKRRMAAVFDRVLRNTCKRDRCISIGIRASKFNLKVNLENRYLGQL